MSASGSNPTGDGDTMASVDDGQLVIADISEDETWLSVNQESAVPLRDCR